MAILSGEPRSEEDDADAENDEERLAAQPGRLVDANQAVDDRHPERERDGC